MYLMNMDIFTIIKIIGLVIAVVIVSSIIITAIKATGERIPFLVSFFLGGIEGKIVLALIVIAIGCMIIRFITGMAICTMLAKACIVLCVVVFVIKIIMKIFLR